MGDRSRAIEFYNSAVNAANDRSQPVHLQHAYQMFSSAVFTDATYGEGWYALGNANNDLKMPLAAIAAWRRALQCELPDDIRSRCMTNLAWQLHNAGHIADSLSILTEVVRIEPKLDAAWLNLGIVQGTLGDSKTSVECHRKAVALNPDDPTCRFGLALALLFDAQYQEGYREFECRFAYRLHQFLKYPYPKWEGEPGKTVFLVADQGLGDTLSYARFVEAAAKRAKFIHIVVQRELMRAFSQAWAHIRNINLMPLSSPFLAADAWTTFVSLPFALGLSDEEVRGTSQIKMPVYSLPTSWMAPDAKLHVGIAWAGSPLNDIDKWRNIPVEQFLELYRVPGIQLYSLQVGERSKDLERAGMTAVVRDLSGYISDVTDTVALLRDLDLVITVESALGHICASVGKECWIPYSYLGHDYRIGHSGEHLLWTPKHRVFKQDSSQDWELVFYQIEKALREKVHGTGKAARESQRTRSQNKVVAR